MPKKGDQHLRPRGPQSFVTVYCLLLNKHPILGIPNFDSFSQLTILDFWEVVKICENGNQTKPYKSIMILDGFDSHGNTGLKNKIRVVFLNVVTKCDFPVI